MSWSIQHLFDELVQLGESPRIEAKQANEIGPSVMQTICAFANEPDLRGGWLLLGIAEPDLQHDTFWVSGVENVDKLLGELQNNCRNQFEHPVTIECKHAKIQGKSVIGAFVHEFDPTAKPCRFIGKPDKHNKRKTGVWRRGANGDYECTERELEPILMARSGKSYEQIIFDDANFDDLDLSAISLYRKLRAQVKPNAEELQSDDVDMLCSMRLLTTQKTPPKPNISGLLLFGKTLSLRRLLPMVRVDYVRIQGTEWVENPEQRFQYTIDLREPLVKLISKLESVILDEMPYHFRLEEGNLQRSDQPLLPQKVIREAIVNAIMHRDYCVHQPIIVARYRNRLEIHNPGYSLKPLNDIDNKRSQLRNPILAAVLYDLGLAETKGTGIRTMQRLLQQAGLTKPVFVSNRESNQFTATFLLHQLLGEEQLQWLQQFNHLNLSGDEAKALVLVKEMRAIDNAALRAVTDLDTLAASQVLRRLWQRYHLIEKGGSGSTSYYKPTKQFQMTLLDPASNTSDLGSYTSDLASDTSDLGSYTSDLTPYTSDLASNTSELSGSLKNAIDALTPRAPKAQLWPIILELCLQRSYSADEIANLLKRKVTALKTGHLTPMRKKDLINYLYPDVINHPDQAYVITKIGKEWFENKVIQQKKFKELK